jgi:hypothetical protein
MNLGFSDLIRYFLSSVVIAKSWEYHVSGKITPSIENNELFFYLAMGIVCYNVYRSVIYENVFANFQDLIFWIANKFDKKIFNYRHYLKDELGIKKKHVKKVFNILNRKYISKMKSGGDFITASSIHFFYMSSIIFLAFTIINYDTTRLAVFLKLTLLAFFIGVVSDLKYEQKELKLLKELLDGKKRKEVDELVQRQT